MTETKYLWTTGPWTIDDSLSRANHGYDSGARCIVAAEQKFSPLICTTSRGWKVVPESEANARLITAAPEMFEALEWLLLEAENYMDAEHNQEVFNCASAALAKARGEP